MAKKKTFEEFRKLKRKAPLHIALVIVLGDLGEYIRDNILKDDNDEFIIDKESEADRPDVTIKDIRKCDSKSLNDQPIRFPTTEMHIEELKAQFDEGKTDHFNNKELK